MDAAPAPVSIRPATQDDLPALAAMHVKSWQQAYAGLLDQAYLDALDVSQRQENWRKMLAGDKGVILLAWAQSGENGEETLAGFLAYNPPREKAPDGCDIEICAIYALQDYWSKGIGYKLFSAAMARFKVSGRQRAYLWVLDGNRRAIDAYTRWGGALQPGHMDLQIGGRDLRELCIVFNVS